MNIHTKYELFVGGKFTFRGNNFKVIHTTPAGLLIESTVVSIKLSLRVILSYFLFENHFLKVFSEIVNIRQV